MQHFDYIFTGSGLAALLTVDKMISSDYFSNKKILLIDENLKKTNDRTWCFWDKENLYESIVSKKWSEILFANNDWQNSLNISPYEYKKINGLDFYNFIFQKINNSKNIKWINDVVLEIDELDKNVKVITKKGDTFTGQKIFNSIPFNKNYINNKKYPLIHQHFVGWFIQSKTEAFNENVATFMDFSVKQNGNTRFMYVLPTSKNEALVEYTLFSSNLLSKKEYEQEIELYLEEKGILNYDIIEKEHGNIPMTLYPFWKNNTENILHIGSAGGWTKASTGYTFKNADKQSKKLIQFLEKNQTNLKKFHKKNKFWFYDLLLIDILNEKNHLGTSIFSSLFEKGNPQIIFKFLDEETSLFEDFQVIVRCPKTLFIKALLKRVFSL